MSWEAAWSSCLTEGGDREEGSVSKISDDEEWLVEAEFGRVGGSDSSCGLSRFSLMGVLGALYLVIQLRLR